MLLTKSQVAHRIQTQQLVERRKTQLETASVNSPVLAEPQNIVEKAIAFVKKHLTLPIVITTAVLTLGCGEPATEEEMLRSYVWRFDPTCRERINETAIEFQRLRKNARDNGFIIGKITLDEFNLIQDLLKSDLERKQDLIYHDHITLMRNSQQKDGS